MSNSEISSTARVKCSLFLNGVGGGDVAPLTMTKGQFKTQPQITTIFGNLWWTDYSRRLGQRLLEGVDTLSTDRLRLAEDRKITSHMLSVTDK